MDGVYHVPIMVEQTMDLLSPSRGGVFIDGTLGGGGHSAAILELLPNDSVLYGIDRDLEAIAYAGKRLCGYPNFHALHGNFFNMRELLEGQGVKGADGILLDLGVSSHQLDDPARGFSYNSQARLDMRMDMSARLSAYDVVNSYGCEELSRIIWDYSQERFAHRIANAIVRSRSVAPIQTTTELAEIIKSAIPAATRREGPHPAKRTFQAIRIEVNSELKGLEQAIEDAVSMLNPDGVIAVITFHSLEDRIVKNIFKRLANPCTCPANAPVCVCGKKPQLKILTPKPIISNGKELDNNPRARSAKLRAAKKLITNKGDE